MSYKTTYWAFLLSFLRIHIFLLCIYVYVCTDIFMEFMPLEVSIYIPGVVHFRVVPQTWYYMISEVSTVGFFPVFHDFLKIYHEIP